MESTPRAEYEARLRARVATVDEARALEVRIARFRLALFVGAAAGLWLLAGTVPTWALAGAPIAAFIALVVYHARARASLARAERAVGWYTRAIARLDGRFAGAGDPGEQWLDETHPYAGHLDILGEGSLYELLCGARTRSGRQILARWLLTPAGPTEIAARQAAVEELRDRLDLREDLAVFEDDVVSALGTRELVDWATGPPTLPAGPVRSAALGLAGLTATAGVASIWLGAPPLVWMLLANLVFWLPLRHRVERTIEALDGVAPALRQVRRVLERIEGESFTTERTRRIDDALGAHDPPASRVLGSLLKRIDALEARENQMFTPVALALLWGTNWSFAIERWRAGHGPEVERWIQAVGELEALLDLSRFAYERPGYVFPTVTAGTTRFEARRIAHPLLVDCTPNDISLQATDPSAGDDGGGETGSPQLLVVTGSNMSGKSTLLRTVGVNAVLAQAGAPVRAEALDMSPLAAGCSIRTLDSLLDGASRFYAEIHAVKRAVDQADSGLPGLFLLDELLHGTNSEDRKIGAEAIVRAFLDRGAIGIITTHDLALAAIADAVGPSARNAHFEFALEGDEIRFDYTLHPGTVRAGNALAIMRAAGLEV